MSTYLEQTGLAGFMSIQQDQYEQQKRHYKALGLPMPMYVNRAFIYVYGNEVSEVAIRLNRIYDNQRDKNLLYVHSYTRKRVFEFIQKEVLDNIKHLGRVTANPVVMIYAPRKTRQKLVPLIDACESYTSNAFKRSYDTPQTPSNEQDILEAASEYLRKYTHEFRQFIKPEFERLFAYADDDSPDPLLLCLSYAIYRQWMVYEGYRPFF